MTVQVLQDAIADLDRQIARLKSTMDDYKRGVLDYDELTRFAGLIMKTMHADIENALRDHSGRTTRNAA